jgi:hypothetical protein
LVKSFGVLEKGRNVRHSLDMRKAANKIPPVWSHQWLDLVNRDMCLAIAKKIRRNPRLMRIPRANLQRWRKKNRGLAPAQREWETILRRNPVERVLEILTQNNDEGQRLRQSDPFVGILSEEERRACFEFDEKVAT